MLLYDAHIYNLALGAMQACRRLIKAFGAARFLPTVMVRGRCFTSWPRRRHAYRVRYNF